jgi:hypothetical protein
MKTKPAAAPALRSVPTGSTALSPGPKPGVIADTSGASGRSDFEVAKPQASQPLQDFSVFARAELQISGRVTDYDAATKLYQVETGLGEQKRVVNVQIGPKTSFEKVRNLSADWQGASNVLPVGTLVVADGVQSGSNTIAAVSMKVVGGSPGEYDFEKPDFWAQRLDTHARNLVAENFGMGEVDQTTMLGYRTYRSKSGDDIPTKTDQDGPVLSRTLYGVMQDALVNGSPHSLKVANEMVKYQLANFKHRPQGEDFTLWQSVVRPELEVDGTVKLHKLMGSTNGEDAGTIPLYEQVYMLAGLSNHFFVTRDPKTLDAITDTLRAFWTVFHDPKSDGFISHVDPKTLKPITDGPNANQINWNSTGDFGPAMLRSLITAIGTKSSGPDDPYNETRDLAMKLMQKTSEQIVEHFPSKDGKPVFERFSLDWTPNTSHSIWQENRAVMGHNAKIAWNLSSYGALYRRLAADSPAGAERKRLLGLADQVEKTALDLGKMVVRDGVNPATGGLFDIVERGTDASVPLTWGSHTDWWQQEQLILMAASLLPVAKGPERELMLETLRRATTFFVTNISNHEEGADHFRVGGNGQAITQGEYGMVTGHSKGLYHSSELYTLAMRLNAAYVTNGKFTHNFALDAGRKSERISVLPDFFVPGALKVQSYRVNGERFTPKDPLAMELELPAKFAGKAVTLEVIYQGAGAEPAAAA